MTAAANEELWHARRREAVGGSDMSDVLGLYYQKHLKHRARGSFVTASPFELWRLKTGRVGPGTSSKAAQRGTHLEPWIIQQAGQRIGLEVQPGMEFVRHPEWPDVRFQANTDAILAWDKPGLLEAKTTKWSDFPAHLGGTCQCFLKNVIPLNYAMQVQMYLRACNLEWGVIGCLIGPAEHDNWQVKDCKRFVLLSFRHNKRATDMMGEAVHQFWKCVESDTPPAWGEHPLMRRICYELGNKECRVRPARRLDGTPA